MHGNPTKSGNLGSRKSRSQPASRRHYSAIVNRPDDTPRRWVPPARAGASGEAYGLVKPASPFGKNHLPHRFDPGGVIVQARAQAEFLTAGLHKQLARFVADLVERFQAVGGKAGRGDENALDPLAGELFQGLVGVRLEPNVATETGLKRLRPPPCRPAEALLEQLRGPLDVLAVRIAPLDILHGETVKAQ